MSIIIEDTNSFNIYDNIANLFVELVRYNNTNPIHYSDYNIPMSNKYYIILFNPINKEIDDMIEYLYNDERNLENPIPNVNIDNSIGFDRDQVYEINLHTSNIKELNFNITNILINVDESNSELCLILDINYLLDILKRIDELNEETHIYDFLLYKLAKCMDKILILDQNNMLKTIDDQNNLVLLELQNKLLKTNNQNIWNIPIRDIVICKKEESIYWKIPNFIDKINITDEEDKNLLENVIYYDIGDEEYMLTKQNLTKIYESNIFNIENDEVLHPLSKMNIYI